MLPAWEASWLASGAERVTAPPHAQSTAVARAVNVLGDVTTGERHTRIVPPVTRQDPQGSWRSGDRALCHGWANLSLPDAQDHGDRWKLGRIVCESDRHGSPQTLMGKTPSTSRRNGQTRARVLFLSTSSGFVLEVAAPGGRLESPRDVLVEALAGLDLLAYRVDALIPSRRRERA